MGKLSLPAERFSVVLRSAVFPLWVHAVGKNGMPMGVRIGTRAEISARVAILDAWDPDWDTIRIKASDA